MQQTTAEPVGEQTITASDDSHVITMLFGDSFYVASHALGLELRPEGLADGLVVAVPNRHVAVFSAIRNVAIMQAIQGTLRLAARLYAEGPGSISPNLYWVRRGSPWVLLPGKVDAGAINFAPPDEFVDVLNGLAEAMPPESG